MLDELVPKIEDIRSQGAIVLLKWDGERKHNRCSVVVLRPETDFVWRKDCDAIEVALAEALKDYELAHK